jgi:hypothetical protein
MYKSKNRKDGTGQVVRVVDSTPTSREDLILLWVSMLLEKQVVRVAKLYY